MSKRRANTLSSSVCMVVVVVFKESKINKVCFIYHFGSSNLDARFKSQVSPASDLCQSRVVLIPTCVVLL